MFKIPQVQDTQVSHSQILKFAGLDYFPLSLSDYQGIDQAIFSELKQVIAGESKNPPKTHLACEVGNKSCCLTWP